MAKRVTFLGLSFHAGARLADIMALLGNKEAAHLVTFVGPDSWARIKRDPDYAQQLAQMDLVISNSDLVNYASKKIAGRPLPPVRLEMIEADDFYMTLVQQKYTVALISAALREDENARECLHERYPALRVKYTAGGKMDIEQKISTIIEHSIDVVLVDFQAGLGEAFLLALKRANYKGLAIMYDGLFASYANPSALAGWAERWYARPLYQFVHMPGLSKQKYFKDYPAFIRTAFQAWQKRKKAPAPAAKPPAKK